MFDACRRHAVNPIKTDSGSGVGTSSPTSNVYKATGSWLSAIGKANPVIIRICKTRAAEAMRLMRSPVLGMYGHMYGQIWLS